MKAKKSNDIVTATLAERGARYGAFAEYSRIAQGLKDVMRAELGWKCLDNDMKEALEMVQHKVARILNGDPRHQDSWVDIAGYSRLVADRLGKEVDNDTTES